MKLIWVSLSLDLLADNLYITICLLHKMLKKTKIITKTYWIVDSTYTVSYPDRCTSCNMSIDRPSRATLENWKGGGEYSKKQIYFTSPVGPKRPPKKELYSESPKEKNKISHNHGTVFFTNKITNMQKHVLNQRNASRVLICWVLDPGNALGFLICWVLKPGYASRLLIC